MTRSKICKKAVCLLLAGTPALLIDSASATTLFTTNIPIGTTGQTGTTPVYSWDGGNIGFGPASGFARVGGANPMGTKTVTQTRFLGWNHNTTWRAFQITTTGNYTIQVRRTGASTAFQPAFSVFRSRNATSGAAARWDARGRSHSFNQVTAPAAANLNRVGNAGNTNCAAAFGPTCFMRTGTNDIDAFVGYANTGPAFTNGEGVLVDGALTRGASTRGSLLNPALPYNATTNPYTSIVTKGSFVHPNAGAISTSFRRTPFSTTQISTTNPRLANASGGGVARLQVRLPAGWYVIGVGGSCADFTCSPTAVPPPSGNTYVVTVTTP